MTDGGRRGPAVTCVVPTHDRPELLVRALRSVFAQTVRPAAVIVVDDVGSAKSVADGFGDRVRYVRAHTCTAGASRNLGAARAGTPLLAFLDDDDTWHPTFLARCLAELDTPGSTVDFAAVWTWHCRSGHRRPGGSLPEVVAPGACLHRNPGLTGSNFVMRADAFRSLGGFDAGLPVNNDLDLFVRALDLSLTYAVVRERLVVQYRTGRRLSSRGPVRASGLAGYRHKYRDRLTVAQRRFLRREQYVALKFPDQLRRRRLAYGLLGWLNTTPRQCVDAVRHRLNGAALYND
ncbi:glycosyltransferase family A protein [Dactylosporangium sp. NPDC005555]|uniref:glycosyltransferase family 2 protein n=1 Tax=Dactylosporangium sp. NPDC005555 TaxID=3154889 RepID=UPI00339FCFE0